MENMNEQRKAISDEALEKVAGGAAETYSYYNFLPKIQKAVWALPDHSQKEAVKALIRDADNAAKEVEFETTKAKIKEIIDLVGNISDFRKTCTYLAYGLKYLAECGKIVYP